MTLLPPRNRREENVAVFSEMGRRLENGAVFSEMGQRLENGTRMRKQGMVVFFSLKWFAEQRIVTSVPLSNGKESRVSRLEPINFSWGLTSTGTSYD